MSWLDSRLKSLFSRSSRSDNPSSLHAGKPIGLTGNTMNEPDRYAVGMALAELLLPGATWEQRRQTLVRQQNVLLTDSAIAALVEQALAARFTNPALASIQLLHADLLDSARRSGISTAWQTFVARVLGASELLPVERRLVAVQRAWMLQTEPRSQRRFLEKYPELLSYGSLSLFLVRFTQVPQEHGIKMSAIQQSQVHQTWNMLFYARSLGGNKQAIHAAYVNQFGGFILDVPDWLEESIQRDEALRQLGRHDQTAHQRIALWQDAIERARREPAGIEPETLAEMHIYLQHAYNEARGRDKPQLQQQEIACLTFALNIYTETRYPQAWGLAQNALGSVYSEYLQGDQTENLEKAIACYRAALRVFTQQDYPVQYALTQNYLGLAYRDRKQENREENQEQAILFYSAALRVLTEQETPRDWAMVQSNLATLFLERLHDAKILNSAAAIGHFRAALRVFTEQDHPVEWATAQNNLGNVLSGYSGGDPVENKQQAVRCYHAALRVRTEQDFPVEWATTQNNLGNVYSQHTGDDAAENQERAIACYQQSLRVFTEQAFPVQWARSQNNLGHAYSIRLQGNPSGNREQAMTCYQAALRVYTRQAFPEHHRSTALNLAFCAGEQNMWELVRSAAASARAAEDDLIALAAGVKEVDTILRGQDQATTYEAFALTRLERYTEAVEVIERGRARGLAAARLLNTADPQRISDPMRRECYLAQRAALIEAQAAVQQPAPPGPVPEEHLARSAALRKARGAFDATVADIRTAGDPADFLSDDFSYETLLHILAEKPTGYALIYLLTTPWGGLALSVQPSPGASSHSWMLDLSALTPETLQREELSEGRESYLWMVFNHSHLAGKSGLRLDWLAETALRPLATWLQEKNISSMTLIPCGILAAFPLLTVPLGVIDDEAVTLADQCVASMAPGARALLNETRGREQRTGVAALGNPYPTHQSLPWGEAEALTLAHLGGDPSRTAIQYEADRTRLLEALRTAQVVDVSSHGIAAGDYLQSRLLLANGESLTLADALNGAITDMHGLRLLILSACQTAIFGIEGVPDEVRSLAAGMLQAGARAVLASLWPVDDRATYLLMVRFAQEWFPRMESEPPAAALARAQRWLRTVTNRELQGWQATDPLPAIIDAVRDSAETSKVTQKKDAAFSPGRGSFLLKAGKQDDLVIGQRYSAQDAEQIVQEVAQRWAQERDPEDRPYANPFYWAGFQLYGW